MKNDGGRSRSCFFVSVPIAIGGGTGGQQAPRQRRTLISHTVTQRPHRAGGCTPGPLHAIALDMQEQGGQVIYRKKS